MKKKITFLGIIIFLFCSALFYPQKLHNISGFIKEHATGDPLTGTNIILYKDTIDTNKPPEKGASTNTYGYFVIPGVTEGTYYMVIRHLGFIPVVREVIVSEEQATVSLNFELVSENIRLQEVIVTGKKENVADVSQIDVSPELLAKLPSITGEVDLFRVLQALPGVNTANELSTGLYVRGSSPDQNLTLIDGVPMYNPAHLGNIATTFNSYAIRDIKLIKGGFPAQYGGRLSSVLDVKLRSGSREKDKGIIGIGLINSFITVEGPLAGKSTFMFSGRGMYYDFFQKSVNKNSLAPRYNFYDLNAKLNFDYSDKNIISISFLSNNDRLYSPPASEEIDYDIQWDNSMVSLNWLHINSKDLFFNTIVSYTNYNFESFINRNPLRKSVLSYSSLSNMTNLNFKQDVEIFWHSNHVFKTGFEMGVYNYDLVYSDRYDSLLLVDPYIGSEIQSIESAFYIQNESEFSSGLQINAGARFYYLWDSKYLEFEPRLSVSYPVTGSIILKTGFGIANQFLHLISRNDIMLPADLWVPSTSVIQPSRSIQYILGVDSYLDDLNYLISIEGYYKRMKKLYEFKSILDYDIFKNNIESQFIMGEGESYGVELFLNKRSGRFTGWIGYTLSWTRRLFDELNGGKVYYPRYDRRNDISVVFAYDISENFTAGVTWMYATGSRYTLPPGEFMIKNFGTGTSSLSYAYSDINTSFMPDYHKLDLNMTYKAGSFEVYLNMLNVYNRNNPFAQYLVVEKDPVTGNSISKLKRISFFPFIPTVGISYKF